MRPTASKLEVVKIPRKRIEEEMGGAKRRILTGLASDEEGKAYSLARDVVRKPRQK